MLEVIKVCIPTDLIQNTCQVSYCNLNYFKQFIRKKKKFRQIYFVNVSVGSQLGKPVYSVPLSACCKLHDRERHVVYPDRQVICLNIFLWSQEELLILKLKSQFPAIKEYLLSMHLIQPLQFNLILQVETFIINGYSIWEFSVKCFLIYCSYCKRSIKMNNAV